jgi:hypothetical protein
MRPKKPSPLFEVRFEGPGIYPERIPLRSLVTTLSAVQRLAAGCNPLEEDDFEEEKVREDESLRLLDVKRGSAVFQISDPTTSDPRTTRTHTAPGHPWSARESLLSLFMMTRYAYGPVGRMGFGESWHAFTEC